MAQHQLLLCYTSDYGACLLSNWESAGRAWNGDGSEEGGFNEQL